MTNLNVNGKSIRIDEEGATPLLWILCEQLDLTGMKYS